MDRRIRNLEENRFFLALSLSKLAWVADGISENEEETYSQLANLVHQGSREKANIGMVHKVLHSPFLEELGPGDAEVIEILAYRTHLGPKRYLKPVLEQVTSASSSGITDEMVPRLLPLGKDITYDRNLATALVNPDIIHLDSHTVELPLSGERQVHVLREHQYLQYPLIQETVNALIFIEKLTGMRYPNRPIIVVAADIAARGAGGTHYGSFIGLNGATLHQEHLGLLMAHELAHYNWTDMATWINEGMANTIEAEYRRRISGIVTQRFDYPCAEYRHIRETEEKAPNKYGEPGFTCYYSLGERLFASLKDHLGDATFYQRARDLHRIANQRPGPG